MHLVYVDDSKDKIKSCFSALAVPIEHWNTCLNALIGIRRTLKELEGVPLRMEFHATDWLGGKGKFVRHLNKPDRARIFDWVLAGVTRLPGVSLFNAAVPYLEDDRAFEWMINRIEATMRSRNSYAIIISDNGKNYDAVLRKMRRFNHIVSRVGAWAPGQISKNITVERVIEDIVYRDSKRSLFIQAADFCAYSLLRSESPIPTKTALGLDKSFMILEPIMMKIAFAKDPRRLGIIR